MSRLLIAIVGLGALLTASPAQADHYDRSYHDDRDDEAVAGAVIGGVLGAVTGYVAGRGFAERDVDRRARPPSRCRDGSGPRRTSGRPGRR